MHNVQGKMILHGIVSNIAARCFPTLDSLIHSSIPFVPLIQAGPNKGVQPTAYSLRFAALHSGFQQRLTPGVRPRDTRRPPWLRGVDSQCLAIWLEEPR